jgi:hypothetical protein
MLRWLLMLAAIYLAAIGIGLMFFTRQFGIGAVPEDATPQLLALMRLLGGPFLGIAVLDVLARNAVPSSTRNAIILANLVGFGAVAANDVHGVLTGEARDVARIFLMIHLAFTLAFAWAWTKRNA